MASGEHSCTRRALLGGAVALPLLGQAGGGAAGGLAAAAGAGPASPFPVAAEGSWSEALAALARAEGRLARFARRTGGRARSFAAQWRVDERYSDLVVACNRRVEALLLVPAPDVPAFARKVALAIDEQAWELPEGEACMARLKADAAGIAAARG